MGIVQTKQGSASSGTTWPFTLTITLDNPTAAGNALIVLVAAGGTSTNPTSIACTLGGVTGNFTQDSTFGSSSDAAVGATWRDQPCAGGQTSVAITATGGTGTPAILATVYECDDLAASPFDKTANSVGAASGTWTSTATATTTQAAERLFGAVFTTAVTAFGTITGPSSPWANLTQVNQAQAAFFDSWLSGSQDVAATGTFTYNGTVTSTPDWIAKVVTYKLAVASAGPSALPHRGGKQWQRRFRHRQALAPLALAPAILAVPAPVMRPAVVSRAPTRARVGPSGRSGGGLAGPPPAAITAQPAASPAALAAITRPARARARVGPMANRSAGGVASQVVTPLGQPSRPRPFVFRSPAPARARTGSAGRTGSGVASAVVAPLGSMPRPMPRPVIQHLPPSRGQAGPLGLAGAGLASGTVTPRGTPGPQWRPQPRRPGPSRALWHGGAAPQAIAPVVTAYQRPPAQFPRRTPQRAVWHGGASRIVTPLGTAPPEWRPQPRRPAPARVTWHGNAGPAAVAPAAPQAYQRPGPQVRRPGPSRAVTGPRSRPAGGQAGPANAAPVTTTAPRPPAQPRSSPPRRAVWHGNASRIVTPLGTPARRPGPVITSRPPRRGQWHGNTGPVPPPASAPPPRWRPLPSRRRPQRARTGGVRGLANALPPVVTYGTARQGVTTIPGAAAGQSGLARAQDGTGGAAAAYGPVYAPAYGSPAWHAQDGQAATPEAQAGQMPQPRAQ